MTLRRADLPLAIASLPPLSPAVAMVHDVLTDEHGTLDELVEAISVDPAISVSVLRLVNSAAFGLESEVSDIRRAVQLLGRDPLHEVVVLAGLERQIPKEGLAGYQAAAQELWTHCVAVACLTDQLAGAASIPGASAAFTAGLLHDLGQLAVAPHLDGDGTRLAEVIASGHSVDQAERDVAGLDHCEVGGELALAWGLPEPIVMVARYHHAPSQAPEAHRPLVTVVHHANGLAHSLGFASGVAAMALSQDADAIRALNLPPGTAELAAATTLARIEGLRDVLSDLRG